MAKVIVLPPNSLKRPLDGARIVFVPRPGGASPAPVDRVPAAVPDAPQEDPAGLMRPAVDQVEAWLARNCLPEEKADVRPTAQDVQPEGPADPMRPAVDQIEEWGRRMWPSTQAPDEARIDVQPPTQDAPPEDPAGLMRPAVDEIEAWLARRNQPESEPRAGDDPQGAQPLAQVPSPTLEPEERLRSLGLSLDGPSDADKTSPPEPPGSTLTPGG
jgi:hypothetical protein